MTFYAGIFSKSILRFTGLVTIIRSPGLTRSHRGVVNEFQKMLSKSGDDGKFFAVLA